MVRHDTTKNTLYCDACKYRQKLYTHNSLIVSQELSKAKSSHECPAIKTVPLTLAERWTSLFSGV
jgi:hypothetical protein